MNDLINRRALLEKAWDADTRIGYVQVVDVDDILEAPAIDPIKHGKWIDEGRNSAPICSECKSRALLNYESDYHKSDYCPHCGAKMER